MSACRPLYLKFDGQYFAQKAYLTISKDGEIDTYTSHDVGNSTPSNYFHDVDMRFKISNNLTESEINELVELARPKAKELLENSEVIFRNGYVRVFKKDREYMLNMQLFCENFVTDFFEHCGDEECEYCNQGE